MDAAVFGLMIDDSLRETYDVRVLAVNEVQSEASSL